MVTFSTGTKTLRLHHAGCEIAGWAFRLEADGASLSSADARATRGTDSPLDLRLSFAAVAIDWHIQAEEYHGEGRLILRSIITNRSGKPVRLGKVHLLDSPRGARLGEGAKEIVCLPLSGLQTPRWIHRIADAACPRESKIKAQFYNPRSRAAMQVGFLTFHRADTVVSHTYDEKRGIGSLAAWCDFAGWELAPGASTPTELFTVSCGNDPCAALESWADHAARITPMRKWEETPLGWVGWAWVDPFTVERYEDVVIRNAQAISRRLGGFGLRYIWVSIGNLKDGTPGNWLDWNEETFPHGHEWLVQKLNEHGIKLGFWSGAFWMCPLATESMEHLRDALLPDANGKPVVARAEWQYGKAGLMKKADRPPIYALDPSHPKVQAFLKKVFETWRKWGVRYYMIDFLHAAAGNISNIPYASHHDKSLVAGPEAYIKGLSVIREAAGDDTYLLASTGPGVHNAGVLDAIRTGNDFGEGRALYADSYFYPATFVINSGGFWTGPLHALLNQATQYYTHRKLYINDSGNVLTVDKPLPVSDAQVHATIHAMSGGPSMIGDDIDRMDAERLDLIKKTLPRPRDVARPVNLFASAHPECPRVFHRRIDKGWGRFDVVAVYNFSADLLREKVDLRDLDLDPGKSYLAWEFWNGEYLGKSTGAFEAVVPPKCVRVFRLVEHTGRPVVLGTDMHLLMGEMEILSSRWDAPSRTLHVKALRPAGEVGSVYVHAPETVRVTTPKGLWIAKDARDSGLLVRARLEFGTEGEAGFSVSFAPLSTVLDMSKLDLA